MAAPLKRSSGLRWNVRPKGLPSIPAIFDFGAHQELFASAKAFFGSDNSGHTAAVLSSLIASAKRHHVDPSAYLRDVFARISAHPQNRLEQLLPDQWTAPRARD